MSGASTAFWCDKLYTCTRSQVPGAPPRKGFPNQARSDSPEAARSQGSISYKYRIDQDSRPTTAKTDSN